MKANIKNNSYLKIFILGLATAFCLLLPYIIVDKGFFTYAGDFNSQQIPFYMYANRMIKSGGISWSNVTDLGSSFVNSYAFYLLGSPFFWLSTLFPWKWSVYLMPLWLMLKFAFAALGAFCWLKRYAKNDNYAYIGAVLYAFSGWAIYNIFFNHFLESVAFFPFMLWALDEYVYEKRKGIFPFFVALNLLNNYFFFVGQVIFSAIYFFAKMIGKEYKITLKEFFLLTFESILGCLTGIALFVPSLLNLLQNPRTQRSFSGFGYWLYSNVQQYFAIALSAFFPPESPYSPNLFTDGSIKWTSISAFVALGGMFGYFIFLKHYRKSPFTIIFSACIIFAFVPILNSSFYAFNRSYYARWFYMPLLILAAMNIHSFALEKEKIFSGLKTTFFITAAFSVFALTPSADENGKFVLGLQKDMPIFWLYLLIALFSLYLLFVIVYNFKEKSKYSQKLLMGALAVILLYGNVHICIVKMPQYVPDKRYKPQNYDILNTFDLNDKDGNYRLDAYKCYNNLGLFLNLPVLNSFNSVVTPSIMEFYPAVGVKRDVSSKPDFKDYALRSLLSVKYVVMPTHEKENFYKDGYGKNYTDYSVLPPYTIVENKYFIPMGFTYDKYITQEQLNNTLPESRSKLLLKALAVDVNIVDKYKLSLENIADIQLFNTSFDSFVNDVKARQNSSCYHFEHTKSGFTSNIFLSENNLVFYSVPYDEGFTAYVNGTKTEVLKVNYGLCGVYAPAGDNEIIFKYSTPGFKTGLTISCFGASVYIAYILILKRKKDS